MTEGNEFLLEELVTLTDEQVNVIGIDDLTKRLDSSSHGGLENRHRSSLLYGTNRLPKQATPSFLSFVWSTFKDRILILLTVAAAISLGIGIYEELAGLEEFAWIEGVAIMVSVVVIVLVNSLSDFQRERQFKALNDLASDRAVTVQQSGAKRRISIFDVLVGDIVHLQPGDIIPADGVVIDGSLSVDESSSTGESRSVDKARGSMIRAETKVLDGSALMIVVAVGRSTYHGRMMLAMTYHFLVPIHDTSSRKS